MDEEVRYRHGRRALEVALSKGEVTVAGLMEMFDGHDPQRSWAETLPVGKGEEAAVRAYLRHHGWEDPTSDVGGRRGLYLIEATGLYFGGEVHVEASFIPEGARSQADLVGLVDFRLGEHATGRDLVAFRDRELSDADDARWAETAVFDHVVSIARTAVCNHVAGRQSERFPDWFDCWPPVLAVRIATRTYPERQLLLRDDRLLEDWIAEFPGRGVLRRLGSDPAVFGFLHEDGSHEFGIPRWVDRQTWFRPTDEFRDPGLSARFDDAREAAWSRQREQEELEDAANPW